MRLPPQQGLSFVSRVNPEKVYPLLQPNPQAYLRMRILGKTRHLAFALSFVALRILHFRLPEPGKGPRWIIGFYKENHGKLRFLEN
jgi:hypothetical protein